MAHFNSVHVGHHDIKQNQVWLLAGDKIDGLKSGVSRDQYKAFTLEFTFEQLDVDRLIVYDQNF